MTPKQDKGYWRRWGAVVRAHRLNRLPKAEQDAERRQITLDITKGRTSEHKKVTNNDEITRLFRVLEFKANPDSLKAALPVANPEMEREADEQRRAAFALSKKGLTLKEIEDIAAPLCRRHHVRDWKLLPSKLIKEMATWKQFQPGAIARRRASLLLPLAQHAEEDQFIYHLRQSPTTQPAAAGSR